MARNILSSDEDDDRVTELRERLTFLLNMADTTLDAKTKEILRGQEGDLKIHGGTIVEVHKRVEIKHEQCAKTLDEVVEATMDDGLKGVFSERVKGTIEGIVKTAITTFFCDECDSVGEVKQEDMIVVWDNNALLRVDYFLWRYNFSSKKIVEHVDSVFAYAVIKRVIDVSTVSPEVGSYAISHAFSEDDAKRILREMDSVTKIVERIKRSKVTTRIQDYFQFTRSSDRLAKSEVAVIGKTEGALALVNHAVRALQSGDISRGYKLFGDVKKSGISIIKETEYLLERVSAVERYYRDQENAKARKIGELYDLEQSTKQRKEEKNRAILSKEADILQAKSNLSSAEDDRRRARRRKEEAESSKNANIAGAVGFGLLTVATLGLASPITAPGIAVCTINAVEASKDEDRAERDINHYSSKISQCEREIPQYRRDISQLDSEIADLTQKISTLKLERDRIHTQRGEVQNSVKYLRDALKLWKEFSQLTEHGMERATLLQRLSAIQKIHNKHTCGLSQQLQSCASAWESIEKKLERGNDHLFKVDFTCHICCGTFHDLPHLSYGNFCCIGCYTLDT